jgi:uncharacterized repeat protein (TIGR03803 family)
LYGTSTYGSGTNAGTVFRLNRDGTGFRVLHPSRLPGCVLVGYLRHAGRGPRRGALWHD